MASYADVMVSIKSGEIFGTAVAGRTNQLKEIRIEQVSDSIVDKILFVGPIKGVKNAESKSGSGIAEYYAGKGSGDRTLD